MTATLQDLLVGNLPPALYRCSARIRVATITRLAGEHGWRVHRIEGRAVGDKETFLSRSAEALQFPGYFGRNWDAFEECLNDMSWEPAAPLLLLFDYAGRFAAAAPADFAMAVEIVASVSNNRRATPAPLAALVRGAGRAAAHLPVLQI